MTAGQQPGPRLPRVDFKREMLIMVTQGRTGTLGYGIRIIGVDSGRRRLTVHAETTAPGANCVVPEALSAPYHVVRVRRTTKPVVFERTSKTVDCPS
jgi:hypothetical protein